MEDSGPHFGYHLWCFHLSILPCRDSGASHCCEPFGAPPLEPGLKELRDIMLDFLLRPLPTWNLAKASPRTCNVSSAACSFQPQHVSRFVDTDGIVVLRVEHPADGCGGSTAASKALCCQSLRQDAQAPSVRCASVGISSQALQVQMRYWEVRESPPQLPAGCL